MSESFKGSIRSSNRVSEGSVTAKSSGAMAQAWERWRLPGRTEGLVSCMPVQAGGALSGPGGPAASGEGAVSGFSVSPTSAPDSLLLLIPCILSGTRCWHSGWLLPCEASFSSSRCLDTEPLPGFGLSETSATQSVVPTWLAEQHCLSLYTDRSLSLPDCPCSLHVHLLESCPSLRSNATSSRKSPWLGAVLLIAPIPASSLPH